MYIYLRNNIVCEFIPEFNPLLPGDVKGVQTGRIYNPETGTVSTPPEAEPCLKSNALSAGSGCG